MNNNLNERAEAALAQAKAEIKGFFSAKKEPGKVSYMAVSRITGIPNIGTCLTKKHVAALTLFKIAIGIEEALKAADQDYEAAVKMRQNLFRL